ncbi:zinc ABC transporter substrate-binding protein [soil metagenome]
MRMSKKSWIFLIPVVAGMLMLACRAKEGPAETPVITYVATIQPLYVILGELTQGRAEVTRILNPAGSPHTYDPLPSDALAASRATALFYVSPELDEWAAALDAKKKFQVIDCVPPDKLLMLGGDADDPHSVAGREAPDPHFWSDPTVVKAALPCLVAELAALDPEGASVYQANAAKFSTGLDALDAEIAATLEPVRGKKVILFHPSFQYLLKRYGLVYAGVIEQFPGKEPTPGFLKDMTARLKSEGITAIFSEPQLAPRAAQALSEEAGVKLRELDPYGGLTGTETYADYMRHNAAILREALQ